MNTQDAQEYLKVNLAPLPKGYYWAVRNGPELALCRVGGLVVDDKQVVFEKSTYASNELLLDMVRVSYKLADELDVDSPATIEDIVGPYHFGGPPATPKESAPKLPWWKRAINWLWDA